MEQHVTHTVYVKTYDASKCTLKKALAWLWIPPRILFQYPYALEAPLNVLVCWMAGSEVNPEARCLTPDMWQLPTRKVSYQGFQQGSDLENC